MTRREPAEAPASAVGSLRSRELIDSRLLVELGASGLMVHGCWSEADVVAAALEAQRRGVDLNSWMLNVVRAGVAAVRVASTGADLVQVERLLGTLTERVESSVTGSLAELTAQVTRLSDPSDGDLARASQAAVDRLAVGVQKLLLGERAVLPETVRTAVHGVTEQALAEIQRSLAAQTAAVQRVVVADREAVSAAVTASTTSLAAQITSALAEVRTAFAAAEAVAAVEAKSARKGLSYERAVASALSEIAANAGDGGATFTGGTPGASGSKVGDAVTSFSSGPRLVMEAKYRAAAITVDQWRIELAAARANRNARVGLGVTPPELMPTPGQLITLIGPSDIVVAWDASAEDDRILATAYLMMKRLADASGGTTDLERARAVLQELIDAMSGWQELDRHAGAAVKAATQSVASSERLRTHLHAAIDRMATALGGRTDAAGIASPSSAPAAPHVGYDVA